MNKPARLLLLSMASFYSIALTVPSTAQSPAGPSAVSDRVIQSRLDSFRLAANFPGMTFAVVYPDGQVSAFASGYADSAKGIRLTTKDGLMEGSIGKTYVAAIAFQLIRAKRLDLDARISTWLGAEPWFDQLPNARDITVRMLMQHTSGIGRYESKDAFTKALTDNPGKDWRPDELLAFVLGDKPAFPAGKGWEYADTNYILLGMILEKITHWSYYRLLVERILGPFGLRETWPSNKRILPGLAQGFAGADNPFGKKDRVIDDSGRFVINPQFEWTGGGVYCTTRDMARWCKMLYEGKAFDSTLLPRMLDGVDAAELGPDTKYGLGVIIHHSGSLGEFYGHSGFFPGYLAEMYYFPRYKMAFALQVNSSDFKRMKLYDLKVLVEMAGIVIQQTGAAGQ